MKTEQVQGIVVSASTATQRRGRLEIELDILQMLESPKRKYRFLGLVGTSYWQLGRYLDDLERRGLVTHEGLVYVRTERALELLKFLVSHGFPEYARANV